MKKETKILITKISAWVMVIFSLLTYHEHMTRMAQEGYVLGYVEGMVATAKKSLMIGAYSEKETEKIDFFLKFQSESYLDAYEEHGGAF